MSRSEAIQQYASALKAGMKYYNARTAAHQDPYPAVLEDVMNEAQTSGQVQLGTLEIPVDLITGTLAAGRKTAFAGNMMPILPEQSEFAAKWISLCEAHLSEGGIHDPITCMEYLGQFYVMEGHKRVSVLKSFGAMTISATVTRVLPAWSEEPAIQAYYEFIHFFSLTGLFQVRFVRPGRYERLLALLHKEPDHQWDRAEQSEFTSIYWKFRNVCEESTLAMIQDHSVSEALLGCLEVYPYEEILQDDEAAIRKKLQSILPDLQFAAKEESTAVVTAPEVQEKGLVRHLLDSISRPTLNIAFVHASDPKNSNWSMGHEEGGKRLVEAFGSQISVRSYVADRDTADEVMEQAVKEQAQVIFATAPTLLAPARRIAALHPGLKVLVCALSVPYTGIRTYYSRMYETKFISGAIAGVLSGGKPLGYIARYPILGVPAAINAFALGARMTAPDVRVRVAWSSMPGDPVQDLRDAGVGVITGHPTAVSRLAEYSSWSTSLLLEDGTFVPLASDVWNWGRMYQKIIRSILDGGWDKAEGSPAVTYWWGLNSGVMDVKLADTLPEGVKHLASILKTGLISGSVHPFLCPMRDQQGQVRSEGDRWFTPSDLMNMAWLCDNVDGSIPSTEELLEMSVETTSLLMIQKEEPKPQKEEPKSEKE